MRWSSLSAQEPVKCKIWSIIVIWFMKLCLCMFLSFGLTSSLMSRPDWLSCSSDSKLSEWSSSVTIRGPWTNTNTNTSCQRTYDFSNERLGFVVAPIALFQSHFIFQGPQTLTGSYLICSVPCHFLLFQLLHEEQDQVRDTFFTRPASHRGFPCRETIWLAKIFNCFLIFVSSALRVCFKK